jgi:hypothetical protein
MFLVLGQIPGTQHQLSFEEILIITLLGLELYIILHYRKMFFHASRFLKFKRYNRLAVQLQLFK